MPKEYDAIANPVPLNTPFLERYWGLMLGVVALELELQSVSHSFGYDVECEVLTDAWFPVQLPNQRLDPRQGLREKRKG